MLLLTSSLKLIAEIALLAMAGQWLLGILAGAKREDNFFYQLLALLTRPFTRLTRWISPRVILDRHIPLAAFLLVLSLWLVATVTKVSICLQLGVAQCL